MNYRITAMFAPLALVMTGCGGGSSSGASAPPVATPAPAPTPAPTPTPPPVVLTAEGAYPLLADYRFFPNGFGSPNEQASRPSDRQGRYPVQAGTPMFTTQFGSVPADYRAVAKTAFGIDTADGQTAAASAPAGATTVSPLTTLLTGTNTEARLERQLGIIGTGFATTADRELLTFVPSAALASGDANAASDAERLIMHNIRVMILAAALQTAASPPDPSGTKIYNYDGVRRYLEAAPNDLFFSNQGLIPFLRSVDFGGRFPVPVYRDDVVEAAARLIVTYSFAMGLRIESREEAAQFKLGIWGYLAPQLTRLFDENSAAAAARVGAITNADVLNGIAVFGSHPAIDVNDSFFPQPDFYLIAPGATRVVPPVDEGFNGDGPLNSNDVHAQPSASDGNHFVPGRSTVTDVSVPAANAGQVTATRAADGTVTIRAAPGFSGVTFFEYTVSHQQGDVERARVYVIVF